MALSFAFDSKTETPESVKRRRDMVDALMSQMGTPDTYGEGIAAIGQGLVAGILNNRANKAETAGRASSSERFSKMFGGSGAGYGGGGVKPSPTSSTSSKGDASYRDAIAGIESGGRYDAVGPTHKTMGRALGKYQVMESNIGSWSEKYLGKRISPDEFLSNPAYQDAIFDGEFGSYVQKYGPEKAAQAWFGGEGGIGKLDRKDSLGTSIGSYGEKFMAALGDNAAAPIQTASLDPGAGVAQALTAQAAQNAPDVATQRIQQAFAPVEAAAIPTALPGTTLSTNPRVQTVRDALLSKQLSGDGQFMPPDQPVQEAQADPIGGAQMADAGQGEFPPAPAIPQQGSEFGDNISTQQLLEMANDPWATDTQRSVVGALLERRMAQSDPAYQTKQRSDQLGLEKQQLEIDQLRKGGPRPMTPAERQQWGIPSTDQRPYAMTAKGPEVIGGSGQTINIGGEVEARKAELARLGIGPDDPRYAGYALTGKMPREDAQDLTATDKKAILEADEMVTSAEGALPILKRALELSSKAYEGMGADWRGWIAGNAGSQAGKDTMEFDNLVQTQALSQLKAIFGAAPTEGERKILLDIAGSSRMPADVRKGVLERAQQAVERRLAMYKSRADDLRGGTFYKPTDAKTPTEGTGSLPEGVTEDDVQHTMKIHGLSREEVLKRLQNAP